MAEGNIDRLSIEIGASSNTASQKINNLVTAMGQLKTAVNQIDSGAAGKLQALAVALKDLGGIGKISISKTIGENIGVLSGALKGIKSEDISMLRQTASAIKTLDGVGNIKISSTIAKNLVDIAAAVEMMPDNTSSKLEKFGSSMQNLKSVSTAGYDKLPAAILNIASAVDSITDDSITRIHRLTLALGRLKGVDMKGVGAVLKAQNDAYKIQNQIAKSAKKSQTKAEVSTTASGGIDFQNVSSIQSDLKQIGMTMLGSIVPGVKLFASTLATAAKIAGKLAKTVIGIAKKGLQHVWNHSAVKKIGDEYKRLSRVLSTFGRIAFYRAVRSAIRFVTDALKEGSTNAYHFAREFGNATKYIADAMDTMSSGNFKMTNQLGAAWATLLATLQPIISAIIALVNRAAAAITQLFAILGGKGTYMKAIDYNKKWAESAGGAAGAAKEWRNQLMGFDEINRLDDQNDGGGGGGGALSDFENMFEEAEITSDLLKNIKKYIDAGEWSKLGEYLGDEFNKMINNIKWEQYGKLIGEKIGHAITTAYRFFKKADFVNLGSGVALFLNNIMDGINFEELGHLAMQLKLLLWEVAYGAIKDLDWEEVGANFHDYLLGAINEFGAFLDKIEPKEIADAIKGFLGKLNVKEIKDALFEVLKKVFALLGGVATELIPDGFGVNIVRGVKNKIKTKLDETDFNELIGGAIRRSLLLPSGETITKIENFLTDVVGLPTDEEWKQYASDAIDWLKQGFVDFGEELKHIFVDPVKDAIDSVKRLFGIGGEGEDGGVTDSGGAGRDDAESYCNGVKEGINSSKPGLIASLKGIFTGGQTEDFWDIPDISSSLETNVETPVGKVTAACSTATDEFESNFGKDAQLIAASSSSLNTGVSGNMGEIQISIDDAKTAMDNLNGEGSSSMSGLDSSVSSSSSGIVASLSSIASQAWETINAMSQLGSYSLNIGGGRSFSYRPNKGGMFAEGGFPEDGLFFANHGEMVGKFSNGRTAVANNEQITAGIANAVYGAFMSAFSQTGGNGGNSKQPIILNINGREFARATYADNQAVAREHGASLIVNG